MKRIGLFMSFLILLSAPMLATLHRLPTTQVLVSATELPWSTVQAVFKKVADQGRYSYGFLIDGYDAGTVAVEASGSGYLLKIRLSDGALDIIILDGL